MEEDNRETADIRIEELTKAVANTLHVSGVLGKIKASLRSSVFSVIQGEKFQIKHENINVKGIHTNPKERLLVNLVRELFDYYDLSFTKSTFDAETMIESEHLEREGLEKVFKKRFSMHSPILLQLLDPVLESVCEDPDDSASFSKLSLPKFDSQNDSETSIPEQTPSPSAKRRPVVEESPSPKAKSKSLGSRKKFTPKALAPLSKGQKGKKKKRRKKKKRSSSDPNDQPASSTSSQGQKGVEKKRRQQPQSTFATDLHASPNPSPKRGTLVDDMSGGGDHEKKSGGGGSSLGMGGLGGGGGPGGLTSLGGMPSLNRRGLGGGPSRGPSLLGDGSSGKSLSKKKTFGVFDRKNVLEEEKKRKQNLVMIGGGDEEDAFDGLGGEFSDEDEVDSIKEDEFEGTFEDDQVESSYDGDAFVVSDDENDNSQIGVEDDDDIGGMNIDEEVNLRHV